MSLPAVQRALLQPSYDGPSALALVTDAPVPVPGPGEVLLRVTAAGVNYADVMQTYGRYDNGPVPPFYAGFEVAGEIVGGEGEIGTHVIGIGSGAFAEYAVVPAAAAAPVPEGWRDEQALGLVLNWATALAALRQGRLAAGETVLVHAAAGGVGQAAVRLAKHYGATVVAAASPQKHGVVRDLGADVVAGYGTVASEVEGLGGADLVLESNGAETFALSLAAAKRVTGRVAVFGAAGGDAPITNWDFVFRHPIHVIGINIGFTAAMAPAEFGAILGELAALREAGVYTPGEPTVYRLEDGPKALLDLEGRGTVGKLAIVP